VIGPRRFSLGVAGIAALLLASAPAAAAPRTYMIVIQKLKFGPLPAQLQKGDRIVWVNRDFLLHSATAADHSFDVDLPAGAKGTMVLTKSGSIPFVCRYHPGMRGVLQVK
jgi:plastocyanin